MNFCSDNVAGAAPEILAALTAASAGSAPSYGADEWSARIETHLAEIFERKVKAFPVVTGTAANALALSVMAPPYGAIYCHEDAHIMIDECGAPEMFTGGAKLVPLAGAAGKIAAADLAAALRGAQAGNVHNVQPSVVSLTQATEAGTCYRVEEIGAIAEIARRHRLRLHIDGARFANALVHQGCAAKEMTWKAGIDALSLGATKNGALAAEIVIFFDEDIAASFAYRRKRAGHLVSKMRFLSAQLDAYFQGGLWLKLAAHANEMAKDLADRLASLPAAEFLHPVEANEIFLRLPLGIIAGLRAAGFAFYDWPGAPAGTIRLVTSFATKPEDVAAFARKAAELSAGANLRQAG